MFVSKDAKNAIIEYKWIENTSLTLTSPPIIYLDYTYDFLGMENFFTAIKGKRRKAEHKNILVFVGAFKKAKIRLIENKSATVRGNCSAAGRIYRCKNCVSKRDYIYASNWKVQLTLLKIRPTLRNDFTPILISFMHPSWIDIIFHLVKRDSFLPFQRLYFIIRSSLSFFPYRILTNRNWNLSFRQLQFM